MLNNDYEPLNVCNMRRAILLVYLGKAEVIHTSEQYIGTAYGIMESPSVVKLRYHIKRPVPQLKLSRRSIFIRDNYTCQYCGQQSKDLTLDHVIPRHKGGKWSWENLVCCCKKCNSKKGGNTPYQADMKLIRQPRRPKYVPFISIIKYIDAKNDRIWRDYLPTFMDIPIPTEVLD